MIKIEIPSNNPRLAVAIGTALVEAYSDVPVQLVREDAHTAGIEPGDTGAVRDLVAGYGDSVGVDFADLAKEERLVADLTDTTVGRADLADLSKEEPAVVAEETQGLPLDHNGVPHSAEWCCALSSKSTFYGSGKKAGQWKKRVNTDEAGYDAWYAGELAKLQGPGAETDTPYDVAAAFGAEAATGGEDPEYFENGADLMVWVGEQTALGVMDQTDLEAACKACHLQPTDLFPTSPNMVDNCAAVHSELLAKVATRG
jgi:hypothetical protein